jgi:hypothetical protein
MARKFNSTDPQKPKPGRISVNVGATRRLWLEMRAAELTNNRLDDRTWTVSLLIQAMIDDDIAHHHLLKSEVPEPCQEGSTP